MSTLDQRIAENLAAVKASISKVAMGREITLVCVTKYAPAEHAAALVRAGAEHLGENLLPAGAEKFEMLRSEGLQFTAHMLGPLQSRKVSTCAQSCDWYQALERAEIAEKLDSTLAELGRSIEALVQVHVGDEETKHGVAPDELDSFFATVAGLSRLRLRGLMCIPPGPDRFLSPQVYERVSREGFRQTAAMFARIQAGYTELPLDTLSMGMSGDYRWAIEEGATMVRVGRALFEGLS
jgi:pyridoxal phosphate enzyme (YggS family)